MTNTMPTEAYRLKIKNLSEIKQMCSELQARSKKVVFTNGCFDILHPGHVRYLYAARQLGDFLVVAVNSDRSVRAIKGKTRPIFPEQVRAELLAALECVNGVFIFDEDTPLSVIEELLPDILVKGGDWAENEIVGSDAVRKAGGEVKRIPYVSGFSTTSLIEEILTRCR